MHGHDFCNYSTVANFKAEMLKILGNYDIQNFCLHSTWKMMALKQEAFLFFPHNVLILGITKTCD